jgi:hypothetical protein
MLVFEHSAASPLRSAGSTTGRADPSLPKSMVMTLSPLSFSGVLGYLWRDSSLGHSDSGWIRFLFRLGRSVRISPPLRHPGGNVQTAAGNGAHPRTSRYRGPLMLHDARCSGDALRDPVMLAVWGITVTFVLVQLGLALLQRSLRSLDVSRISLTGYGW